MSITYFASMDQLVDCLHRLLKLEANSAKRRELENHMNATLDVYEKILAKQRYIAGDVNVCLFLLCVFGG